VDILTRVAVYLLIVVCAFGAGFIKGCEHDQQQYKEAETKFVTKAAQIVEVEKRVEVPKFIQTVTTIHTESEKLVQEARNETPNPDVCDFAPDRLSRLRQAATGNSQ